MSNAHRLLLLRHGETEWSKSRQHTSRTDLDLTENGQDQAKVTAEALTELKLKTPMVISSPRRRALVTAELAGLAVDEVSPLLAEWDYGEYEGLTTPEIRKSVPGWLLWRDGCPGGESVAAVSDRADRAVELALEHMASRDVVFVGHGHFSRAVLTRWLELPLSAGHPLRHGRRVDRGVRFRARRAPARGAGVDRLPAPVCAGHVTAEPSFVLAGRDGAVMADGVHTAYPTLADARAALAHRDTPIIMGALPFDIVQADGADAPAGGAVHRCAAGLADAPAADGADRSRRCRRRRSTAPASARHCRS